MILIKLSQQFKINLESNLHFWQYFFQMSCDCICMVTFPRNWVVEIFFSPSSSFPPQNILIWRFYTAHSVPYSHNKITVYPMLSTVLQEHRTDRLVRALLRPVMERAPAQRTCSSFLRPYHSPLYWFPLWPTLPPSFPPSLFLYSCVFSTGGSVCSHLLRLVPRSRIILPWIWRRHVPTETSVHTRSTRSHIREDGIIKVLYKIKYQVTKIIKRGQHK
jgi:hypothetical protein